MRMLVAVRCVRRDLMHGDDGIDAGLQNGWEGWFVR